MSDQEYFDTQFKQLNDKLDEVILYLTEPDGINAPMEAVVNGDVDEQAASPAIAPLQSDTVPSAPAPGETPPNGTAPTPPADSTVGAPSAEVPAPVEPPATQNAAPQDTTPIDVDSNTTEGNNNAPEQPTSDTTSTSQPADSGTATPAA